MPDTAQSLPIFGFGTSGKSPWAASQFRLNLYVEKLDDPDKGPFVIYSRPGLVTFANATVPVTGHATAMRGVVTDALWSSQEAAMFAQYDQIISVLPNGSINSSGSILSTNTGVVRAAQIGDRGVLIDGTTGYEFIASVTTPTAFDLASFPGAADFPFTTTSVCAVASRIVAVDPAEIGRFRWSAAGDVTSWAALDFATAESSPDPLTAVFEMAGQLLLFGTQTIEFWAPAAAGAAGQLPFVRVGGANIQWGTTAIDTIRKCNDSVIFLGRNQGGNRQVVQLKGYDAHVVSTPDMEFLIAQETDATLDAATAIFIVITGHPFYVLNLSTFSLVYDISNDTWSKWQTGSGVFAGKWSLPAFNKVLVTSPTDGHIYYLDPTTTTDDGATMTRQLTSKHAQANLARLSLRELRINARPWSGMTLSLEWSKDGGLTYGTAATQTLGTSSNGLFIWRNLGRSRDWVFRVTQTDTNPMTIIDASVILKP